MLRYQWEEALIPYWQKASAFAAQGSASRSRSSRTPASASNNPANCLRLRDAVGPNLGVNFDPSHLFCRASIRRRRSRRSRAPSSTFTPRTRPSTLTIPQ